MQRPQHHPGLAPQARRMKPAAAPAAERKKATKYRGLRQRGSGKWVAEIQQPQDRKRLYRGYFDNAEDAALTYDQAARRLYGHAATLNFPGRATSLDGAAGVVTAAAAGKAVEYEVPGRGGGTREKADS